MRKSKTVEQLPIVIFDKCIPEDSVYYEEKKGVRTASINEETTASTMNLERVIGRIIAMLEKPLFALKHLLYSLIEKYRYQVKLPWLKLSILGLALFILGKKDMQFNVSFKAPLVGASIEGAKPEGMATSMANFASTNSLAPASVAELHKKKTQEFIKAYGPMAVAEMKASGVPASIKMAQAIVESRSGTSRLAVQSNNFFGMKCKSKCLGCTCRNYGDDTKFDMFRVFDTPVESWKAHTELMSISRYSKLKKHGKDYKKWAEGLKRAGYATDKKYDKKLINIIETYKLYKLDK